MVEALEMESKEATDTLLSYEEREGVASFQRYFRLIRLLFHRLEKVKAQNLKSSGEHFI